MCIVWLVGVRLGRNSNSTRGHAWSLLPTWPPRRRGNGVHQCMSACMGLLASLECTCLCTTSRAQQHIRCRAKYRTVPAYGILKCGHAAACRGGPDLHSSMACCVMVFSVHTSVHVPPAGSSNKLTYRVSLIAGTDRLMACVHTVACTLQCRPPTRSR